ncbi:RIP metalloprotease RseP [Candidatus Parcubacteria bacterium]|nr:RIP metalloprotease RseP [Candidatus Parcubacteria bacterium]
MFLTIITFILVLSLLVFVHELGHFWVARKFGLKPKEFGFGFPPRAWGIYKNKDGKWKTVRGGKEAEDAADTIYSINWIPIGGFVNVGEDEEESDNPNHFINKPIWQRATILSAGVTMNVVLAAVLIIVGLMVGLPQVIDEDIDVRAKISDKRIQIVQVLPDSPAKAAGVKMGDIITGINESQFIKYEALQQFVDERTGQELSYKIKRGREEMVVQVTPVIMEETGKGGIGIAIAETGTVKYPWYLAITEGIKTTFILIWVIILAFYELFKNLIIGNGVSAELAGPVGIAALTGQMARMGFVYVLQFTALLSINLAIINFLPIPALDGGRVLFLIIEKIRRKSMKRKLEAGLNQAFFILLMLLVLIVTFRDVAKYGDRFKMLWEKIIG